MEVDPPVFEYDDPASYALLPGAAGGGGQAPSAALGAPPDVTQNASVVV